MKSTLRIASIAVLAIAALSAQATVLDFNDFRGDGGNGFESYLPSMSTQGFDLDLPTPHMYFGFASILADNEDGYNYTGSIALINPSESEVALSRHGGGAFNLTSLDLAGIKLGKSFDPFTLTGHRADGSTVSQTLTDVGGDVLHTYGLTGFTNLTSVTWMGGFTDGAVQMDNVNVQAVPEPTSFAALGLGALGLLRRRFRKAA